MKGALCSVLVCGAIGCGPDDLFVTGLLEADDSCTFVADPSRTVERALFDISDGAATDGDACSSGYVAHLLVDNPNDEDVLIEGGEVRLSTTSDQTILFDADPPLPNPYRQTASSPAPGGRSAPVFELIPRAYAPYLTNFVGGHLIATTELSGSTSDGAEDHSNRFDVAIEICDGCRTVCLQRDVYDSGLEVEDVTGNACHDDTGADERFCIDPDC